MTFKTFSTAIARIAAAAALAFTVASCGGVEISNGKGTGAVNVDEKGTTSGSIGVEFDFSSISSKGGADQAPPVAQPAKVGEAALSEGRPAFGKDAFNDVAPDLVDLLMGRFGFTANQAAGIVGNLAHESAGFTTYQEASPIAGRGGAGWAQWTGPRRRSFEAWSKAHGFDTHSFAANWGFLEAELLGSHASTVPAVRATRTLDEAMRAFERTYERAGVKHYASRAAWSRKALSAWNRAGEKT